MQQAASNSSEEEQDNAVQRMEVDPLNDLLQNALQELRSRENNGEFLNQAIEENDNLLQPVLMNVEDDLALGTMNEPHATEEENNILQPVLMIDVDDMASGAMNEIEEQEVDQDDDVQRVLMYDEDNMASETEDQDEILQYNDSWDETIRSYATLHKLTQRGVRDLLLMLINKGIEGLPRTYQTLFNTPTSKVVFKTVEPGQYYHIGLEKISKELKTIIDVNVYNRKTLNLCLHIDGISLTQSSTLQAWTILGSLSELPNIHPFLVGIYVGLSGPKNFDLFLEDLAQDLTTGSTQGFLMTEETKIFIKLYYIVSDAPARSKLTHTMGTAGLRGCPYCSQVGTKHMRGATQYKPCIVIPLRTDVSYASRMDQMHFHASHKERDTGVLENAGVKMVSQMVPCAMHTFDLGVMKKIIRFIYEKKGSNEPGSMKFNDADLAEISRKYEGLKKYHPKDFTRSPRSMVLNWNHFKAVECRYMYYYGPYVFKDILNRNMYQHFLKLCMGARLLADPNPDGLELAQELLQSFVADFSKYYGEQVTYVVHTILHFKQYVEIYGPMYGFSAYDYENRLRTVKDCVRKMSDVLLQFRNRIAEKGVLQRKQAKRDGLCGFLRKSRGVDEFSTYIANSTLYIADQVNCFAMIRTHTTDLKQITKIIKFKSNENVITFEYQNVHTIGPYFSIDNFGVDSTYFDIYVCSNVNYPQIFEESIDNLLFKMIATPIDDSHIILQKMIHSCDYN